MTHYIYIPGFNDRLDILRRLILRRWVSHDSRVTLVPMRWADKSESYDEKYSRIKRIIDQAGQEKLVLVGESAGGAMALFAFAKQTEAVHAVITICGYNHGAEDIHVVHRRDKPAFYPLSRAVDELVAGFSSSQRRRITTIYSTADRVVTPSHSNITGAREVVLHHRGHFLSIASTLVKTPKKLLA